MNKSLRFLAIGLALAVLLVSQVGVDRSTEAADVSLSDEEVQFAGVPGATDATEEKDYYRPDIMVNFYVKDNDLALPPRSATVTWSVPGDVGSGNATTFGLGARPEGGNGADDEHPTIGGADSFPEGPMGPGQGEFSPATTYSTSSDWAAYRGDDSTPLAGTPELTVNDSDQPNDNGSRLVTRTNVNEGQFDILGLVSGQSADVDDPPANGTTTIEALFKYHVADVFETDVGKGTGAGATQNRAKIFSNSDSVGEWVTITEVTLVGSTSTAPQTDTYWGAIEISSDSKATASGDGKVWVRDGDTITVEVYEDDNTTVITSDTATIDAENPSISGVSPSDGTVTDDSSPVVSFTVIDDGAGFDTGRPKTHVTVTVDDCVIPDGPITATRLSRTEMELLFRNPDGSWAQDADGILCADGTRLNIDSESDPQMNNHGTEFTIKVEATDGAGNTNSATAKVTIDTEAPAMVDRDLATGTGWADGKETSDRASIKVVFDESLDPDTVDASDFSVENPDVSIEDVIVGGVNKDEGTAAEQQLNELVFLVLSADLSSDARPRVELDGSVTDVAGNELKSDAVSRINDGIEPGVTVDAFPAQLLAKDGKSAISLSADENMSGNVGDNVTADCTCLGITGGGSQTVKKGDVALPTPSTGTYTFKQSGFKTTGIYGILVQASDSSGNETREGATKVTDEKVTATDVSSKTVTVSREPTEGDASTTTTNAVYTATVKLAKWPLADAGFTGSLEGAVSIKGADGTKVTNVDWGEDEEVTLEITHNDSDKDDEDVVEDMELLATYSYVMAEQTIEIDTDAPGVTFEPTGDTEIDTPFIRVHFDDDEYAGDTHTTVTITSATLTDADDNEWVLVDDEVNLLSSSDWKSYSYLPATPLALGEYTITVVGRDEAGNATDEESGKFKIVARPPVSIPLNLGWNLISLPAEPADSAIDTVINVAEVSQVLTYDPTIEGGWLAAVRVNGAFEGGLTNIDATRSYLVYTTSVDPLKVDIPGLAQGSQEFPPAIQLHKGWNMVPASSLNPDFPARDVDSYLSGVKWSRGYYYDSDGRLTGFIPGDNDDDELVVKGRGFIIYVTETSTLVP